MKSRNRCRRNKFLLCDRTVPGRPVILTGKYTRKAIVQIRSGDVIIFWDCPLLLYE